MSLNARKWAPALAALVVVLAGCQTAPGKDKAGMATTTPGQTAPDQAMPPAESAGASPVEFYLAQTQAAQGLMEVKLPDGALYMQRQAVLTRADLIEAAALVDKQGQNFVGLRFSEAGARKLNDISSQNIGKMLALVVERQLVAAPRISEPLNRGVLAFSVSSAQEANELATAIRGDVGGAGGAPAQGMQPARGAQPVPAPAPAAPGSVAPRAPAPRM